MKRVTCTVVAAVIAAAIGVAALAPATAAARGLPRGYTVVHTASITASAGLQQHGVETCPTGKVVISGGATVTAALGDVFLNGTYPEGTTAWGVDVNNANLVDATFQVWAVCARKNAAYGVVQSFLSVANSPGTQTLANVACPPGTKVLGGGASSNSASTAVNLNGSYPSKKLVGTSTQYMWTAEMNNASSTTDGVTAFAVCGSEPGYKLVKGAAVSNPSGQSTQAGATCPGAKVPVGGGLATSTISVHVNLIDDSPQSTGWDSDEGNGDATGHKITPYAICAGT